MVDEILTDLPRASVDRRKMSDTTKQTKGMDFAKRHLEKLGWKEGRTISTACFHYLTLIRFTN